MVRPEKKSAQFSTSPDDTEEKDNHFFVQMHGVDRQLPGGGGGSHQAGLLTIQKISTTTSIMPKFQIKFFNAAWQNIERIADYYLNGLGPKYAESITEKLLDTASGLSELPYMGALYPDPVPNRMKYKRPYQVAEKMDDENSTCVAMLHNVMEDTPWTLEMLKAEVFPSGAVETIALMTHDRAVPYMDYVDSP